MPIPAEALAPGATPPPRAPQAVEYNLGETTITQARFPEDSRFRNMPGRLTGLIAAPETGGPHPVVVIFHGNHPGCPTDEMGVDRWPCAPEVEQPNYQGFGYLVRELAARHKQQRRASAWRTSHIRHADPCGFLQQFPGGSELPGRSLYKGETLYESSRCPRIAANQRLPCADHHAANPSHLS